MTTLRHETQMTAAPDLSRALKASHQRTLDAIFRHPLAHNLSWREIVILFNAIGIAEEKHDGEFLLHVGAEQLAIRRPHDNDLAGSDVMDLRRFLTRTGWVPDAPAATLHGSAARELGSIVVIDHAGARIYRIDRSLEVGPVSHSDEPKHIHHQRERKNPDNDREELYPADERFFEEIAVSLSSPGEIVLIGHGNGQSNEGDHLSAYLQRRHKDVHRRIVRELHADLPRLTSPELLELGRRAFVPP